MSRRPGLRTRVYASNLGMVEQNYKQAMERLEKSRRPASADRERASLGRAVSPRPLYDFNGCEFDEELAAARSRASKVIHERSVIDQRAEALRSSSLVPVSSDLDFDDQVQATLNRIRASKDILSQLKSDDTLEQVRTDTRAKLAENTSRKMAEKLASVEDDFNSSSSEKRSVRKTLKIRATADSASSDAALRWKDETAESFAAKRANATKARLADLDVELEDFEAKQAARARRSAQLKKLLAETEELIPATTTEHAGTKVTTGMVKLKTKKVVSF
ncbi:hypothetical protein quinque_004966 [Culex quinquefasciatus]|uniref:uncharacterized protein LOC120418017 n=1 Tax=Culex pipiens pallens TaxID=42434 RepID=UPI0019531B5B|nr:uncharacterized protein LOC120418017 [Culex pipiens pallens]